MSATPECFRIADLGIRCRQQEAAFFSDFQNDDSGYVLTVSDGKMLSAHGISYAPVNCGHYLFNDAGGILGANADWSEVLTCTGWEKDPDYMLLLAAICSRFAAFDTVLLHGSFVDFNGMGIVFVGPSGIGKTTQARLWSEYLDAEIVNGDKVMVRSFPETISAYGLPWRGSSSYCLNRKAPLRGIVAIRQEKENRIRRLNSLECMEYFVPHAFLPYWDRKAVEQVLRTLDQILNRVPVWLLACLPDEEAVLLTRDAILG